MLFYSRTSKNIYTLSTEKFYCSLSEKNHAEWRSSALKPSAFFTVFAVLTLLFFSDDFCSSEKIHPAPADNVGAFNDAPALQTTTASVKSDILQNDTEIYKPSDQSLPESFDLRKLGLVSGTRTQGNYNTCWAICALESLETQILKNNYEDSPLLSPWHLSYFAFNGEHAFYSPSSNVFKAGGTNTLAAAVLSRWIGPVSEYKAPYDQSMTLSGEMKNECEYKVTDVLNLHSWISEHKKYETEFIKELIYNKNSVSCFINSDKQYYDPEHFSFFCSSPSKVTHAVLLVGWDDNFSKENFPENNRPQHDGAWIVKNSWGESWGDNGYFLLSYEDKSLSEAACYFCKPCDAYKSMLSYDEYGWTVSLSPDQAQQSMTGYMSGIYSTDDPVMLSAVSFYTTEENAGYDISVYKKIEDITDPVSGTSVLNISGTEKYTGYHTIDFPAALFMEKDTPFSVVIKLKNIENPYMIASEASSAFITQNNTQSEIIFYSRSENKPHQSFVSSDGIVWHDTANCVYTYRYPEKLELAGEISGLRSVTLGDVCLKVLTSDFIPGDTEPDGSIDIHDYIKLIEYFLNIYDKEDYPGQYDTDQDNSTDITDVIRLKSLLCNEIS